MSLSTLREYDEGRRESGGYTVKPGQPTERCSTCVWGDAGCLEGHCLRKSREVKPAVDGWVPTDTDRMRQLPVATVTELQTREAKANETLLRNLANRKAVLNPTPKQVEGSTPLIHARRRVVQAVLGLAHFETRFGQGGDQLKNRKADLEMAMIEWENELLKRAGVVVK